LSILILPSEQDFFGRWEACADFAPDQQLEWRIFVGGFSASQVGSKGLAHHRCQRLLFFQRKPFGSL
jgi:hypothetical protein